MEELEEPQTYLGLLGLKIKWHWEKYCPRMYRELEQRGQLNQALLQARETDVGRAPQAAEGGGALRPGVGERAGRVGVPSERGGPTAAEARGLTRRHAVKPIKTEKPVDRIACEPVMLAVSKARGT